MICSHFSFLLNSKAVHLGAPKISSHFWNFGLSCIIHLSFSPKGRHKMAVAGVLSFLMEKEEKVDQGDWSFFKGEVTDRDCLAEMTILCQTHTVFPPVARMTWSLRISQEGTRSSAYSSKLLCLRSSCSLLWKKKGNPVLF